MVHSNNGDPILMPYQCLCALQLQRFPLLIFLNSYRVLRVVALVSIIDLSDLVI